MFPVALLEKAKTINHTLAMRHQMIVTAESCTGGLVSGVLTDLPGSSDAVFGGYVTYANTAKQNMIGVPAELLRAHGAVSEPVARAMAEGARRSAGVAIAIAITGIAGPGGGTDDKPVGLVHLACAIEGETRHLRMLYGDLGRQGIREAAVATALDLIKECLGVK